MRAAIQERMARLEPIKDRINKQMADLGLNSWFRITEGEVQLHIWDIERVSGLSHSQFEELGGLSDDALLGIAVILGATTVRLHQRGFDRGQEDVRSGMINLLGLRVGISD